MLQEGLKAALADLRNGLSWVERMDITSDPVDAPKPLLDQLGEHPDILDKESVHDDFKREMRLFVVYLLHKMSALTHSPIYLFHSRLPISLYSSLASLCLILLPYISLFYPPLLLFHSRYSFLPLT